MRRLTRRLTPLQILLLGFLLLAAVGGLLLMLPISSKNGRFQPYLDALFMASSAISTTGLGVVALDEQYTLFGQLVMLALIQIGGLGYMTLIAFITQLLGQRLSLGGGKLMASSLAVPSRGEMRHFILRVVQFTIAFEAAGAIALTLYWQAEFGFARAFYMGWFHAISTFCTAGFSLLGDGFVTYRGDWVFNAIINSLSLVGAVGFFVLHEGARYVRRLTQGHRPPRLTTHTRLALFMTAGLIGLGTAVIFLSESPAPDRLLPALFQALTATTTTGFNTVAIDNLSDTSLTMLMALMFIGAPAGGTGGGIKATTFAVLLLLLWAMLRGQDDVNLFGRRLNQKTIMQSVSIGITAVLWLMFSVIILTATESASFLSIMFEAVSALGTVGLSMGLTANLSAWGKIIIIGSMMIGRIGPLGVAYALVRKGRLAYRYPQEDVFVG